MSVFLFAYKTVENIIHMALKKMIPAIPKVSMTSQKETLILYNIDKIEKYPP